MKNKGSMGGKSSRNDASISGMKKGGTPIGMRQTYQQTGKIMGLKQPKKRGNGK